MTAPSDDDGRRDADVHVGKSFADARLFEQEIGEGEAARFPAERASAEARQRRLRIERGAIEVDDDAPARLLAIGAHGAEDLAPQVLDRVEVRDLARAQLVREREFGARLEPAREVVPLGVVRDALGRHPGHALLELAEIARAHHLAAVRQAKHEVAERQLIDHEPPELLEQRRRSFQQERRADRSRERLVLGAVRLQHHRDVGLALAHAAREFETGVARNRAAARELDVRNHAEDVLFEIGEVLPCLLERAAQQDLRLRLEPHQLVRQVHAFGQQPVRLPHQLGVDRRQKRRVEADVVFDDEDRLHAEFAGIVRDVAAIFDVLDDGGHQAHVALPEEHTIDRRALAGRHDLAGLAHVVRERDDRRVDPRVAHAAREPDS
ncbi:MAG: hypothetical protein AUI11_10665 [Acidobacteria bacterium 13_2_20CM_2_66_4]|nr:MAG: hypothetical protein AUI11_10665 [Acidobacteria bacterium 13_2_20CM_2_66_4]